MKLTTLIMCIALMQVSAATLAQKVTLKASNAPLSEIFKQIRTQTGYDFAYTIKTMEGAKPVTINVKNEELKDVLNQIFDNQPLDYSLEDKTISVTVKQPTILEKIKSAIGIDKFDVTGQVIDIHNQPVSGATVTVKGTSNVTNTDVKGQFTLKNVDPKATIVITFIGFTKKEIPAQTNPGTIILQEATNPLDEVKVIAYGQTTDRLSVGNTITVKAADIARQPVNDPLLTLEGRVPGLYIQQTTGLSGGAVNVNIQGLNSINNGNTPFFVIDGIPYLPATLPTLSYGLLGVSDNSFTGGSIQGSPLNFINTDDIESISILQDADATAIYGSRAANGAILITTKKGKAGKTIATVNVHEGIAREARQYQLLNTQQYLAMRHEAFKNDGITPGPGDYDVNGTWDTTRYTNWQKVLLGGSAHYTDINGSVSGGGSNTQFLVSGTYKRQTTVFPADHFADQIGGLHFNLSNSSENKRFHLELNGSYNINDNLIPSYDPTNAALTLPPDAPPLYNKDGSLNWAPNASGSSTWTNPLAGFLGTFENKTNTLNSNLDLSYELLRGLTIKTDLGYVNSTVREINYNPLEAAAPEVRPYYTPNSAFTYNNYGNWTMEPQLTYNANFGKSHIDAIAGATIENAASNGLMLYGSGFTTDSQALDPAAATTTGISSSTQTQYRYAALFSRVAYNFDSKYIVNASIRRDGSSRFGDANKFHDFWSVGGAWVFSDENWLKESQTILSYGKIRINYGTTGNDQISDYRYLDNYTTLFQQIPYQGIVTLYPPVLANPYLQWELTKKLDIGIDAGFLKDRITVNISYFSNRSSNQLVSYPLPSISGFTSISENLPATVGNTGLEIVLSTTNIKTADFSWITNFNFTKASNKLIAYPGISKSSYGNLVVGQPFNIVNGFHYLDVNPTTGLYEFAGVNGPTSNPDFSTDLTKLININPKFYGGFNNSFIYKGYTVNIDMQFVNKIGRKVVGQAIPGSNDNMPVAALDSRWHQPGDIATGERYTTTANFPALIDDIYYQLSDNFYTDASFIRVKNISFSKELPVNLCKLIGFRNISLFFQGQNLFTFTNYKYGDPEAASAGSLPPLKVLTFGATLGL